MRRYLFNFRLLRPNSHAFDLHSSNQGCYKRVLLFVQSDHSRFQIMKASASFFSLITYSQDGYFLTCSTLLCWTGPMTPCYHQSNKKSNMCNNEEESGDADRSCFSADR